MSYRFGCLLPVMLSALVVGACYGSPQTTTIISTIGEQQTARLPASATLADPKNDLVDGNGKKAKRQPMIDITALDATSDGSKLHAVLTVAGDVPAKLPATLQEVSYLIVIEADQSGDEDYNVLIGNTEKGGWSASLVDQGVGESYAGELFPGAFSITGNRITVSVPLTSLGSPTQLRISAITQVADHESGDVTAEDQVPMGEQYRPDSSWLMLET